MLTEKSDMYNFCVVLLEIICGRQPIDVKLPVDDVNIIRWVRNLLISRPKYKCLREIRVHFLQVSRNNYLHFLLESNDRLIYR